MIKIYTQEKALRIGVFELLYSHDENGVIIFSKTFDAEKIIVIINNGSTEINLDQGDMKKVTGDRDYDILAGVLNKSVQPLEGCVIKIR